MEDTIRRKLDKFERQQAFFTDNAADFPAGTPGGDVAAANAAIVSDIQSLAGDQFSEAGASQQATDDKNDLLERLVQILRNINRAANAFQDEIPGSDQQFRLPRNRSETNLLAAARSFHEDATPLKPRFIEYGLDATFLDELTRSDYGHRSGRTARRFERRTTRRLDRRNQRCRRTRNGKLPPRRCHRPHQIRRQPPETRRLDGRFASRTRPEKDSNHQRPPPSVRILFLKRRETQERQCFPVSFVFDC